MRLKHFLATGFLAALATGTALAGTLSGTVKNSDGKGMEGVMVRLSDADTGVAESIFTDSKGEFVFKTTLHGKLDYRLRSPYFRDVTAEIKLGEKAKINRSDVMQAMTSPEEISESLPAAYHFGSLPFETGADAKLSRVLFQRDCLTCHQLGNAFTRYPRSAEDWAVTIKRMHSFLGNFDAELRDRRSAMLSMGFDGKPISVRPSFPLDPALAHAKVYEYQMPEGLVPHDAEVGPNDGLVYTVDQFAEHMAVTDLKSGKTNYYKQPDEGNPPGGHFTELGLQIPLGASLRHGPHSLAIGPDGKWYVTNSIGCEIGVFNPKTRQWERSFKVGGNGLYPHTIRIDKAGMVWFTLAFSEQVGRLNPKDGKVDLINLPTVKPLGMSAVTTPYGIDINPKDGFVWYSRLFGDKIGKIDPKTLQVTEYASPVKGPRRMRFDAAGILWLTGYSEGILARIDPAGFPDNSKVKLYPMPEFAKGFRPAPYALAVNPDTQEIWINETMTDRLYRFLPRQERFIVYPVPLTGTYTRETSFTKDGKACMSNNPAPREALEGGVVGLICIDPKAR
jgi:streptogramin lyase